MKKRKSKEEQREEYIQTHIARIKRLKRYHKQGLVCVPMDMKGAKVKSIMLNESKLYDDDWCDE